MAAYLLAPATVRYLWRWYRYGFRAIATPIDFNPVGSKNWRIKVENRSHKLHLLDAIIYPELPQVDVLSAIVLPENDGGFKISNSHTDDGALILHIDRIAPGRVFYIDIKLSAVSTINVFSKEGNISFRMRLGRAGARYNAQTRDALIKKRVYNVLLSYIFGIAGIILYLIYLAVFGH